MSECVCVCVCVCMLLTTVWLLVSSTINRSSLMAPDPSSPPNSAALLSPTGVRVNSSHGGGGCPVNTGELHLPVGNHNREFVYATRLNVNSWYNDVTTFLVLLVYTQRRHSSHTQHSSENSILQTHVRHTKTET